MKTPSQESQKMLESLKAAAQKTLEKKKRLDQYAVVWVDNKPVFVGDDKPPEAGSGRYNSRDRAPDHPPLSPATSPPQPWPA